MSEDNRRIIIVEDEPEALKGYEQFLTASSSEAPKRKSSRQPTSNVPDSGSASLTESYELILCSSGEEAISRFNQYFEEGKRIAAGFFDVKLGSGIDGLQTIQAIQKIDPQIHCVIVTAYHDRSVEEIHRLFGEQYKDRWDYLNKPFNQGEIIQKARQMTSAWNRLRQIERMQGQLVASERQAAIGQVARGIGHEFGNILLRIMGKTDLALLDATASESVKKHLEVVLNACERASVIVRNLQSFSKAEPNLKVTPLSQPIEDTLSLVNHELVKASIEIEKNYGTVPEVKIDTRAISQVILNLLINSIHAMPSGGKIQISLQKGNNQKSQSGVLCKIKDAGQGIPADVLPRIFEAAFTTKGDQGSGLGLSISKDIVTEHGGEISVQTKEGQGTEFSLWFPAAT